MNLADPDTIPITVHIPTALVPGGPEQARATLMEVLECGLDALRAMDRADPDVARETDVAVAILDALDAAR